MRICINTVYNSHNCGSYWQARALGEYLKQIGYQPYYLKREAAGTSHSTRSLVEEVAKSILKGDRRRLRSAILSYKAFSEAISVFDVIDDYRDVEAVILGSDTIWQLNSDYFVERKGTYWGIDAIEKGLPVISFAPSLDNSSAEQLNDNPECGVAVSSMSSISVRDEASRSLLRDCYGVNADLVCDPTMLLDQSYYFDKAVKPKRQSEGGRFLFSYYFGEMPCELESAAKRYAENEGIEFVSYFRSPGEHGVDRTIDPFEMLYMFAKAEKVVTNTFHGVMFSLIFNKQVVVNSSHKNKVADLVDRYGLNSVDYASAGANVDALFSEAIDYLVVNEKIKTMQQASQRFLSRSLNEIGRNHEE